MNENSRRPFEAGSLYSMEMLITPELARQWLTERTNPKQHKDRLGPGYIKHFIKEIRLGRLITMSQGISFDINGHISNGHNRLTAIAEAGITVRMYVTFNDPVEAFMKIDRGRSKSLANVTDTGRSEAQVYAMAAKLWDTTPGITSRLSEEDFLEAKSLIGEETERFEQEMCKLHTKIFTSVPMRTAAILTIVERPNLRKTVYETYSIMARHDAEGMIQLSSIAKSFYTSVMLGRIKGLGGGEDDRTELFTRAHILFDPANKDFSKIMVRDNGRGRIWAQAVYRQIKALRDENQEKQQTDNERMHAALEDPQNASFTVEELSRRLNVGRYRLYIFAKEHGFLREGTRLTRPA